VPEKLLDLSYCWISENIDVTAGVDRRHICADNENATGFVLLQKVSCMPLTHVEVKKTGMTNITSLPTAGLLNLMQLMLQQIEPL
jgi:hypothetical protein